MADLILKSRETYGEHSEYGDHVLYGEIDGIRDSVEITESISILYYCGTKELSDSEVMSDSIKLCGDGIIGRSIFNTFKFGTRKFGKNLTMCSPVGISEDTVFKVNGEIKKSLNDIIPISENKESLLEARRLLSDSISITDSSFREFNQPLVDNINFSENIVITRGIKIELSDNLIIDDLLEIQYVEGSSLKSDWKFLVKDENGQTIASLTNARNRWFVDRVNDGTEAGFILDADDSKCNNTILKLGINELHIVYKGVTKWSGQLISAKKIAKGNDIYREILAKDWVSLLGKRFCGVENIREFVTTDAGLIFWTLIDETQSLPNGDYGITLGTIEPSIVRSPSYDKKNILEAGKEMANAGEDGDASYGIDFEITPQKVFNAYYPYRGTIRENVVFRYPGNCLDFEELEDTWGIVNQEWGLGQHWTGNTAVVSRADVDSQVLYKRREAIKNYKDMSVLSFLQDTVWQDVQWLKDPSKVVRFSSRVDAKSGINSYNVGDGVSVICDDFEVNEWLWVYERKIEIGENDELKVTLTVGN